MKRLGSSGKAITLAIAIVLGVLLCYLALGPGLYYWKENVRHDEAGALSGLEALHTIEMNYKSEHGAYVADFAALGMPQGAYAHDGKLTFNEGYYFEFANVTRDDFGRVTDFCIRARPVEIRWGSHRNYIVDAAGNIHVTTENRPATIQDRNAR
jgi:hypothetical protein